MHLLLIDNHDSFTYNLVQLFAACGVPVRVVRNDAASVADLLDAEPSWICISPGPRDPAHAGISAALVRAAAGRIPVLGVCLGMQVINEVFGGRTERAPLAVHGMTSAVHHDGTDLFRGVPSPFRAARYHSLVCAGIPDVLRVLARTDDGIPMAVAHTQLPVWGVQFHPESFMSEHGVLIARNFLATRAGVADHATSMDGAMRQEASVLQAPPRAHVEDASAAHTFSFPCVTLHVRSHVHTAAGTAGSAREFVRIQHATDSSAPNIVLLSGGDNPLARHSVHATDPWMVLLSKNGRTSLVTSDAIVHTQDNVFDVLDTVLQGISVEGGIPPGLEGLLCAGYIGYEARHAAERLPAEAEDDLGLPDVFLLFPARIALHDAVTGVTSWLECDAVRGGCDLAPVTHAPGGAARGSAAERQPDSTFTRAAYRKAVARIIEYILDGDVYQVNLSQRFTLPFSADPFTQWLALFDRNPAAYYAFIDAGDHQVLSTSMEQFFWITGSRIETRPIKGTRPRGTDAATDASLRADLLASAKDEAELSMIIDLMRNDLGRVCDTGSIRVTERKRIDAYANVFHLSGVVEGALRADSSAGRILRALFPAGSITGCPKIRAMEIIDELEPVVRHAYTGAIGYITADGSMEFSVAIRTAVVHDGLCRIPVGGGIVRDSDPDDEYNETLHKGRTMFEVLGGPQR